MIVRRASHTDIYAIARVHDAAIRSTEAWYTARQIDSWAANIVPEAYLPYIATSDFFVAVDDESGIVGFASLDRKTGEVASMYVGPPFVRRGAGRRLMAAIEDAAREATITRLEVTAAINALPFYRAVGFSLIEHSTSRTREGVEMPCGRMAKKLA